MAGIGPSDVYQVGWGRIPCSRAFAEDVGACCRHQRRPLPTACSLGRRLWQRITVLGKREPVGKQGDACGGVMALSADMGQGHASEGKRDALPPQPVWAQV